MTAVYLDYNATAPMKPAVKAAMAEMLDVPGNASSVHRFGRAARRAIEEAREQVARLVGAMPGDVVFTSGATEANNMALLGVSGRALVSAIEQLMFFWLKLSLAAPKIATSSAPAAMAASRPFRFGVSAW